ncbi:hypothetical protein CRG98_014234 [Punica granatum]|uniref:Ribosomal protein mS38 C-terminal domain-containing protein n=1 Tax=Punica granatum TaxID=22663 RepID=A0A2I0K9X9_PUNGR|nr:hypothetical protein CRG98_014234 [Punica granatum]
MTVRNGPSLNSTAPTMSHCAAALCFRRRRLRLRLREVPPRRALEDSKFSACRSPGWPISCRSSSEAATLRPLACSWAPPIFKRSSHSFRNPQPQHLPSSPNPDQIKPGIPLPPRIDGSPNLSQYQQLIFPNSPFGFCSSPVSSAGVKMSEEAEGDDQRIIRADSVKKKRKRKMNKHKYKKLRKRLRRKAK